MGKCHAPVTTITQRHLGGREDWPTGQKPGSNQSQRAISGRCWDVIWTECKKPEKRSEPDACQDFKVPQCKTLNGFISSRAVIRGCVRPRIHFTHNAPLSPLCQKVSPGACHPGRLLSRHPTPLKFLPHFVFDVAS